MKARLFTIALVCAVFTVFGQENDQTLKRAGTLETLVKVPSLASRINEIEPAINTGEEAQDSRSLRGPKIEVVPGKGNQRDVLSENPHELTGKIQGRAPSLVFDAVFSNSQPTDPALAVGPNHVMVVFNTGFAIYDKDGVELVGQTGPGAIFGAGGCCDLTVSYDAAATSASNPTPGRWVLSFLVGLNAGARLAVSQGPDPVNDGWNVYFAPQLRDYNKLSVYGDGYFMADNDFSFPLVALERQAMLDGEPAANVSIQQFALPGYVPQNFIGHQILNVSDDYIPSLQNVPIVYQQDDAFGGVSTDHVKFWNATIDFDVPANSSVSAAQQIDVSPYTGTFDGGSFANLAQPNGGGLIDALQGITMNQAQFRKFSTHNSAVFNHVIDVDPSGGKLAAIRWYEFRQTTEGQPWTLEQEGTYTSPDGKHAWNASLIMDEEGNIGMGYSGMDGDNGVFVSSYYTGRFANDPAGTMTVGEELIAQGGGNVPSGANRYGDYSKIDIDPSDDQTFWFITEYISPGNGRADVVGRFKIAPDATNDTGVIAIVQPETGALSTTETIEVTVRNFGVNPQSNVPVSFTVDGGTSVNEVIAGPIPPSSNVTYTFMATGDLGADGTTYSITACTGLVGDEDVDNNCVTKTVIHLNDIDTGVVAIDAPNTGNVLSDAEDVAISIQNFGALTQSNIPVFYSINGVITNDVYPGPLVSGATDTFTFGTPADLSVIGVYTIISGTELASDADETNDDLTKVVENIEGYCLPTVTTVDPDNAESGCNLDGIKMFVLNTISADDGGDGCNTEPAGGPKGYADRTDLSTVLSNLAGSNVYNLQAQVNWNGAVGVEALSAWIDFNDDLVFEESERLISGEFFSVFGELDNFELVIPVGANEGPHVLRVKAIDTSSDGDVLDPCSDYTFGETQDYTVDIQAVLGIGDSAFVASNFTVITLPNNQFELSFNASTFNGVLPVYVYNMLGQNLAYYVLKSNGSLYSKTIDMSYVSAGVYFIKVGNRDENKVHRIIVK
jgi:hypothetical protein